ncbi:transposase family protein [Devosia sp.]|uniref:transposase family protein n=1 Tax=Devosia sp. TaxID=1871048 RepID=UPI0025CC8882|nr:transposase family protein [Devosia sp.]MCR6634761.1 transposase family protein [Devosia sp.]
MTIRLTPPNKRVGAYVRIRGERHMVVSSEGNGRRTFLHIGLEKKFELSASEQKELEIREELTSDEDFECQLPAIQEALDTDWDSFTEQERESALYKKKFMVRMDQIPASARRSKKPLDDAANEVQAAIDPSKSAPSARSLKRWHFRWITSGKDARALADMNWKKGNRPIDDPHAWMDEIIVQHIEKYMMRPPYSSAAFAGRLADAAILRKSEAENLPLRERVNLVKRNVGANRIYELLERLGYYDRLINKLGRKEARRKVSSVALGPQGDHALHEVEVDHTQLDIMVFDANGDVRRPWLTVLIDRYSRMILGYFITFDPPSWVSVMMALRMAVMPKVRLLAEMDYNFMYEWDCYGCPDNLYMDRGAEFLSYSMRAAAERLNIRLVDLPRASGYLKGKVERWFNVHNQGLIHALPGYTGRNPTKRMKESAKPKLELEQLQILVTAFIVDVYNQKIHGTTKQAPAERFSASFNQGLFHKYPPRPGLLGPATDKARPAVLTRTGIRFDNLVYQSDELYAMYQRRGGNCDVIVKQDMANAGRILVFDAGHVPWVVAYLVGKYAGQKMTVVELNEYMDADSHIGDMTPEEKLKKAQAIGGLQAELDKYRDKVKFQASRPPTKASEHITPGEYEPDVGGSSLRGFDPTTPAEAHTHGVEGSFAAPTTIDGVFRALAREEDPEDENADLETWMKDLEGGVTGIDLTYKVTGISQGAAVEEAQKRSAPKSADVQNMTTSDDPTEILDKKHKRTGPSTNIDLSVQSDSLLAPQQRAANTLGSDTAGEPSSVPANSSSPDHLTQGAVPPRQDEDAAAVPRSEQAPRSDGVSRKRL